MDGGIDSSFVLQQGEKENSKNTQKNIVFNAFNISCKDHQNIFSFRFSA
jgi:hypothetical protein